MSVDTLDPAEHFERPATPPPPYNVEDTLVQRVSASHNPEGLTLEAGASYQFRGSLVRPCTLTFITHGS